MAFPLALIPIAIGAAQATIGIVNNAKAKKRAKELERSQPKYPISDLAQKELDLGESEAASGGMSARAERAYNNINDKQFSSSLSAILKGGGDVNNVADLYGENDEGRQRIALLSDQLRMSKIRDLSERRGRFMQEQDKDFMYNKDAPWKNAVQATSMARQMAQQDTWKGIGTMGSAAMQWGAQAQNAKLYEKYFGSLDHDGGGGGSDASVGDTSYYNGYNANSGYSDFQDYYDPSAPQAYASPQFDPNAGASFGYDNPWNNSGGGAPQGGSYYMPQGYDQWAQGFPPPYQDVSNLRGGYGYSRRRPG